MVLTTVSVVAITSKKEKGRRQLSHLNSSREDWNYALGIKGQRGKSYELNGKKLTASSDEIKLVGKENRVVLYH